MRIAGAPGQTFWALDGEAAARAIAAANDVALLLDEDGVIHDAMVRHGTGPAREIAGWPGWTGRRWAETVLPASVPAVEALLREAVPASTSPAARWQPVAHLPARDGAGVPVLYTTLRPRGPGEGPILAAGRDLLGLDLVGLILAHDAAVTRAYVAALRARGTGAERLCLDVLAPAARRLGALWVEDRCDFTQVTDGVGRLQEALRGLRPGPGEAPPGDPAALAAVGPRVLLAPVPGEQHGFGLHLVAAFLGWAGFQVTHATPADEDELAALARRGAYALVGLSASGEPRLAAAASAIRRVRRAAASAAGRGARGAAPRIMLGGRIFTERPSLARDVGADATAVDAQHAAIVARELLSLRD